ncbi:MAG: polyphenol oxidase family protein [Acidimicrobiia bacterium]
MWGAAPREHRPVHRRRRAAGASTVGPTAPSERAGLNDLERDLEYRYRFTERGDGDFVAGATAPGAVPGPVSWLRQVHGAGVVVVDRPGQWAGAEADGAVTSQPGCALAVRTADCAPVVLLGRGAVGVAHAGWRGLVAGVLEATVAALGDLGTSEVRAVLGPSIGPECYEFGHADLAAVTARTGARARSATAWATAALDLRAGVRSVLAGAGVPVAEFGGCTACEPGRFFSHRARAEPQRHAAFAWLVPTPAPRTGAVPMPAVGPPVDRGR